MQFFIPLTVLASIAPVLAAPHTQALNKRTLDPASSNTKGVCPANTACSASKVSTDIQAAECSHNTRVSGTQTFAVFVTDHQWVFPSYHYIYSLQYHHSKVALETCD